MSDGDEFTAASGRVAQPIVLMGAPARLFQRVPDRRQRGPPSLLAGGALLSRPAPQSAERAPRGKLNPLGVAFTQQSQ